MPVQKQAVTFGTYGERVYGYAQAVRVGDTIYVSGQTALGEGGRIVGEGDMRAQMRQAYANIARALQSCGADMGSVVDETLYVTDMAAASAVAAEVRREAYGGAPEVASTLVQVAALGAPALLVEIRCIARV